MKNQVEFINTCSCCDGYGNLLKDIAKRFPEKIDLKIYYAGKDFDYLPKYGNITRGTLVINGKDRYEDLNRRNIEKIIAETIGEAV